MPVIPALQKLKRVDRLEFEASLDYTAWTIPTQEGG